MATTDQLIDACLEAMTEAEPTAAVREVLSRAVSDNLLTDNFKAPSAGLKILYRSTTLTVLNVIWPPLMSLFPHDHRMWAAIGIYSGREDNSFYRRTGNSLQPSGGKELLERAVVLLGSDVIHAVRNPARSYTGAIHVYGGDFVGTPRSQWDSETLQEQPYDLNVVQHEFDRAERAFQAAATP